MMKLKLLAAIVAMSLATAAQSVPNATAADKQATAPVASNWAPPAPNSQLPSLDQAKRDGTLDPVPALDQAPTAAASARLVMRPELRGEGDALSADVRVSSIQWSSGSPAVTSRADGTLFCVVDDQGDNYLDIYTSLDGGAVWSYFFSVLPAADATHPAIAVGEGAFGNRLLIVYELGNQTAAAAVQAFWYDLDAFESATVTLEALPYGLLSHPRICVDSPEYASWYPYVVWVKGTIAKDRLAYTVEFSRSTDGGATWSGATLASGVPAETQPSLDFGGNHLFLAYERNGAGDDLDIYARRSDDYGATWLPEFGLALTADDERTPAVAATRGGDFAMVAFDRHYLGGTGHDIDAKVTSDGGGVWSSSYLPYTVDDETRPVLCASLILNRVYAVYRRGGNLVQTASDHLTPSVWRDVVQLDRTTTPDLLDTHALTAYPGRTGEALAVWGVNAPDGHAVYAGAAYPLGRYLIITANMGGATAVVPLASWKQALGYHVEIITFPEIRASYPGGDDAEAIWAYLTDHEAGLRYVLLVGDVDNLPMRLLYPDGDHAYPASDPKHDTGLAYGSDYYYAKLGVAWDLDGDDRWGEFSDDNLDPNPDLLVGRVPFNDTADINEWCQDVVAFEQDNGAWKRDLLLAAGFFNYAYQPGDQPTDGAVAAERIRTDLLAPAGWQWTRLYEKGGIGPSPLPAEAGLSLAEYESQTGAATHGIVCVLAHGSPFGMSGHRWLMDTNSNGLADLPEEWSYNQVTNENSVYWNWVPSFTLLAGCSTGVVYGSNPGYLPSGQRSLFLIRDPLDDSLLKNYLHRGAPAVVAATAGGDYSAHWTGPSSGAVQSLAYYIVQNAVAGMTAGEALFAAQRTFVNNHGFQRGIRVYQLYGDPSLRVVGAVLPEGVPSEVITLEQRAQVRRPRLSSTVEKSRELAVSSLWSETADLEGCTSAFAVHTLPGGDLLVAGMATADTLHNQGVLFRSPDGGESWARSEIPGSRSVRALCATQSGALLCGGLSAVESFTGAAIHRSTDGGLTWTPRFIAQNGGGVTDIRLAQDGSLWAAGGWNGDVYRSVNDGVTWTVWGSVGPGVDIVATLPLPIPYPAVLVALAESEEYPALLLSEDGVDWRPVDGLGAAVSCQDLLMMGDEIFAAVRANNQALVLTSPDLGSTWAPLTEFPSAMLARSAVSLAAGPSGQLYAGLSSGRGPSATTIYTLPAGEVSWQLMSGMMDLANEVNRMLADGNRFYAVTGPNYGNVFVCALPTASAVDEGQTPSPRSGGYLAPPRPNPCNPQTTVSFDLPRAGHARLEVFDGRGRRVRSLMVADLPAGWHQVVWDGRTDDGRSLASGQYLLRLTLDGQTLTPGRKVLLVK